MNDLHLVGTALAPDEPSQEVVDRSRHQLQNRMRGRPAIRRRTVWLTAGTGLTVAAAVAVVAVVAPPAGAPSQPSAGSSTTVGGSSTMTVSGPEVLLAAATAAENASDGSGTYWYVKTTSSGDVYEYWTKADGQWWFRGEKTDGKVKPMQVLRTHPFSLFGVDMTLEQLRALPTEPAALTAWIAEAMKHSKARTSAGALTASDREQATLLSLVSLVSTLPAPPAVRAAAFRAIAAYPGVQSLGAVPGGEGVVLPGGARLVVDPATGRVNRTSMYVVMDSVYGVADPDGARVTAEWTSTLPS
jgi:hypothetical protein